MRYLAFLPFLMTAATGAAETLTDLIRTRDVTITHEKTLVSPAVQKQVKALDLKGQTDTIDFSNDVTKGPRIEVERRDGQITRLSEASAVDWSQFKGDTAIRPTETSAVTNRLDGSGRLVSRSACESQLHHPSEAASLRCLTYTKDFCERLRRDPNLQGLEQLEQKLNACTQVFMAVQQAWSKLATELQSDRAYQEAAKADAQALKPVIDRTMGRTKVFGLFAPHWDVSPPTKAMTQAEQRALTGFKGLRLMQDANAECRRLSHYFGTTRQQRETARAAAQVTR